MLLLTPSQTATLRDWFRPERPGPLVGPHVIQTGHGVVFADRWPAPRVLIAKTADNYSVVGDPEALRPEDVRSLVVGFLDASERFEPLLRATFPASVRVAERVGFVFQRRDRLHALDFTIPAAPSPTLATPPASNTGEPTPGERRDAD